MRWEFHLYSEMLESMVKNRTGMVLILRKLPPLPRKNQSQEMVEIDVFWYGLPKPRFLILFKNLKPEDGSNIMGGGGGGRREERWENM